MKKTITIVFIIIFLCVPNLASAILSLELTKGVVSAIPIAIIPFLNSDSLKEPISEIISHDLQNSGRFKIINPPNAKATTDSLRSSGADHVVMGKVIPTEDGRYRVLFQLMDIYQNKGIDNIVIAKQYHVTDEELRRLAHHISDLIYEKLTGAKGIFSTKIAYIVVQRNKNGFAKYFLEVSDQDGYNPKPLLSSVEPIMSPAWSPNGRQLAYVSFENKKAGIFLQDIITGSRRLLTRYPGINGAPAWSPDGRKLALVLSKSGSPNIYILDVAKGALRQITNDYYINTEPAWSPNGESLIFTSNKSGGPQIYQYRFQTNTTSRLTFDGSYNARASFTQDGKNLAMIHRVSNNYHIALLELDTGYVTVLNKMSGDSASPSIAPNGSMILYDTLEAGRNVLGMVSRDGRIQLRMPSRLGEAQDPAWSPFLS